MKPSFTPLHDYIDQALYSESGYYMRGSPVGGRGGDFITAPEMTQVFGEVLGLWAVDQWMQMGSPSAFQLVELGPGRGTLMADALRAARVLPAFMEAVSVSLVEVSPSFRALQRQVLAGYPVRWFDTVADLPPGPAIILANEFFDALPINQYIYVDGWRKRGVSQLGESYEWAHSEEILELADRAPGVNGQIVEECPLAVSIIHQITARKDPCSVLIIDYGYDDPKAVGDTLQALRSHAYHNPLVDPGTADITHHVNFGELAHLFQQKRWSVSGPLGQGEFLTCHGLMERTEQLAQKARPEQASSLRTASARLVMPNQMGVLFRVLVARSF